MNHHSVWAREASTPSLAAKVVLLVLASHANEQNCYFPGQPVAYPSLSLLEKECRLSRQGVLNALRKLQDPRHPLIGVDKVDSFSGPRNVYRLLVTVASQVANKPMGERFQSTVLTPPHEQVVNCVDPHQSTVLTPIVNVVDPPSQLYTPPPVNLFDPKGKNKEKEKEKKKTKPDFDPCRIALPDWLPSDVWADWVRHRREIGHRLTPKAAETQIKNLERAMANGHAPTHLIAVAISSGWRGCVFDKHLAAPVSPALSSPSPESHNHGPATRKLSVVEIEQARIAEFFARKNGGAAFPFGRESEKDVTDQSRRVA